jgi:phage N-6-adenine-methyltransferase
VSANDKTGVGSGPGDWQTPPALFSLLNRMFAFDYDAFASHENALCGDYSTADGTFSRFGLADVRVHVGDGLTRSWENSRVFMNPPYSRGFLACAVEKAASERNNAAIIVALLPDARDTAWWRKWVRPYAADYPIGRVRFLLPDGTTGASPPGGNVVALYLPDWLNGGKQ